MAYFYAALWPAFTPPLTARISRDGIDIAQKGYDIDTATEAQMTFSSKAVAMRLLAMGYVTCTPFNQVYYAATVNFVDLFGHDFDEPPIVLATGIFNADAAEHGSWYTDGRPVSGTGWIYPRYCIETHRTHFRLLVDRGFIGPEGYHYQLWNWKYFVFANTLDA